jgi:hypothetical protein
VSDWTHRQKRVEDCCKGTYEGGFERCPMCLSPARWGEERVTYSDRAMLWEEPNVPFAPLREFGVVARLAHLNVEGIGPTRETALLDLKRKVAEREALDAKRAAKPTCPECGYHNPVTDTGTCVICNGARLRKARAIYEESRPTEDTRPVAKGWTKARRGEFICAGCVDFHRDGTPWLHPCSSGLRCDRCVPRAWTKPTEDGPGLRALLSARDKARAALALHKAGYIGAAALKAALAPTPSSSSAAAQA